MFIMFFSHIYIHTHTLSLFLIIIFQEGISVNVNGMEHRFYGSVFVTLCDTLAAHQLGGFKVGVGFSLRKCRDCMATYSDIQEKVCMHPDHWIALNNVTIIILLACGQFVESEFRLRDPASYDKHCQYLEGELRDYDSVTYGINYESPLNKIHGFHVANNQLPQDVMHILLEGTVQLELKLMLSSFIWDKTYFTIELLNDRICYFDYSSSEARNKPPKPFTTKMLASDSTKLHLSGMSLSIVMCSLILFTESLFAAAQTWSCATYLPLLIGDKVPEEDSMWLCFFLKFSSTALLELLLKLPHNM